jgi:NADPH-ferrihemoprotein reductase
MEESQETVAATSEPFFSLLDFILLGVLLGGAAWWLLKNKKKEPPASVKSYSIQPTAVNTMTMAENSFIKKLKSSGRSLVVFYGSQTGTAEEFAGRLAKEGIRYRLKGMVADPEECDMEELLQLKDIENSLAVFCLATYGEGDPTDNAMEFYELITNGDVDLTGLNYSVSTKLSSPLALMTTWNSTINSSICVIKSHSTFDLRLRISFVRETSLGLFEVSTALLTILNMPWY